MAAVLQFMPRLAPFEQGKALYWQARNNECLDSLRGHVTADSLFVRARAAIRLGRPELATEALTAFPNGDLSTNSELAEFNAVLASAALARADLDGAREALDAARIYAFGAASVRAEAEYEFYEANLAFALGNYDETNRAGRRALNVEPVRFATRGYGVPLAHTRARTQHLLGMVCAVRGDYGAQIAATRVAREEMSSCDQDDAFIRSSLLMNIAFHVRDCDHDATDDTTLLEGVSTDDWPLELAMMAFEIHRALGWSAALRGDHLRAFRAFRRTSEHAWSPARKVLASVDRAFLARELGEAHSAREEIEHTMSVAEGVDWSRVGEERIALAQLAQEAAAFAPVVARSLFERYRKIRANLNPLILNAVDSRARAFELMAEGTVLKANGETDSARSRFVGAFDIWSACGQRWRAATAALELSDTDNRYAAFARAEAASRPNSWLARRVTTLVTDCK